MQRIFILCEGRSEENYIKLLNLTLQKEYAILDLTLIPYSFNGGLTYSDFTTRIKNKIKEIKRDGVTPRDKLYLWIDKDVFLRKYPNKQEIFKAEISNNKLSIILVYNYMNFEDFLILHYSEQIILNLQKKLEKKKHFLKPLIAKDYEPIYETIIQDYIKGRLPNSFKLNLDKIKQCVINMDNEKYKFKSEIKEILELVIQKCEE